MACMTKNGDLAKMPDLESRHRRADESNRAEILPTCFYRVVLFVDKISAFYHSNWLRYENGQSRILVFLWALNTPFGLALGP